jgi:hypothetical protein
VIEHVPVASGLRVTPLTVQTLVVMEAKLKGRPELAVAFNVKAGAGNVTAAGVANVIVCGF